MSKLNSRGKPVQDKITNIFINQCLKITDVYCFVTDLVTQAIYLLMILQSRLGLTWQFFCCLRSPIQIVICRLDSVQSAQNAFILMCSVSARMVGTSRGWQAICLSHSVSGRSLTSARASLYMVSLSFALSSMAIGFPFSMTNFQEGVFQEYIMPALTKLLSATHLPRSYGSKQVIRPQLQSI